MCNCCPCVEQQTAPLCVVTSHQVVNYVRILRLQVSFVISHSFTPPRAGTLATSRDAVRESSTGYVLIVIVLIDRSNGGCWWMQGLTLSLDSLLRAWWLLENANRTHSQAHVFLVPAVNLVCCIDCTGVLFMCSSVVHVEIRQ